MSHTLAFADLELCYDELADALDALPADQGEVFLAKLVLCLAHEVGDRARISAAIQRCLHEPDTRGPAPVRPL